MAKVLSYIKMMSSEDVFAVIDFDEGNTERYLVMYNPYSIKTTTIKNTEQKYESYEYALKWAQYADEEIYYNKFIIPISAVVGIFIPNVHMKQRYIEWLEQDGLDVSGLIFENNEDDEHNENEDTENENYSIDEYHMDILKNMNTNKKVH